MYWCSKEPSHCDCSFEYSQHIFLLRNEKNIKNYPLSSGGLFLGARKRNLQKVRFVCQALQLRQHY